MTHKRNFDCDLTDKDDNEARYEGAIEFVGIGDSYEAQAAVRGAFTDQGVRATNINIHKD